MFFDKIFVIFQMEYYTTTSKFSKYRKIIPIYFIIGTFFIGYIIYSTVNLFKGDNFEIKPPIGPFFSIIVTFSYFTLFSPLLSYRVIYDTNARSKRETVLSAPVRSRDLLFGNLLSNLVFYLPFFTLMGTIMLSPFIGYSIFPPFISLIFLIITLSLQIIIGLIVGTLLSPIIFDYIARQRNDVVRSLVSIMISAMLVLSLPILRYFIENVDETTTSLGWVQFLPFVLTASIIIYILYGSIIGLSPIYGIIILILLVLLVFIISWLTADFLYGLSSSNYKISQSNPKSRSNKFLNIITAFIPTSFRNLTRIMIRASIRDIEHIARMTIGVAVAIFMIFALSSGGLFRNSYSLGSDVELAFILFSLILSATSVIYIETTTFMIQHKQMLSMIKSAPNGAKKLIISKAIQMFYFISPIYLAMVFILKLINIIKINPFSLIPDILLIIITLICISLGITIINPADNEEDISNFINLIILYVISFILASIPVIIVISHKTAYQIYYIMSLIPISLFSLVIAIHALQRMNIEMLSSPFSEGIINYAKAIFLLIIGWNIIPLAIVPLYLFTDNVFLFILGSSVLTITLPLIYYITQKNISIPVISLYNVITLLFSVILMFVLAFVMLSVFPAPNQISYFTVIQLIGISRNQLYLLLTISVLTEEVFFRGYLLDILQEKHHSITSVIVSSIFFALFHSFSIISIFNALFQSIILGLIKIKTKHIIFPILAHLIFNFTLIFFIL